MILATDLDGTLLYPRKPIGVLAERNRNFLRRLHAQGHAIVAVSGRNSKILPDLNKDLGFAVPFIGCNGGFIIGEDGKLIEKRPIDKDVVLELYASMIDRCGIGAWLVMDETEQDYFDVHNLSSFATVLAVIGNFFSFKYGEKFSLNRKEFLHRLSRGNICKLEALTGIGIGKKRQAREASIAIADIFSDSVRVSSTGIAIEMTARGVSKGEALKRFIESRGYALDEVIVVGDSGNDVSMFDLFPHSFVMSHAEPWVKAHANHVVKGVFEVQRFIDDPSLIEGDRVKFPTEG